MTSSRRDHVDSQASAAEHETLLPHDTPILQAPDSPLRMNIITGTAVLAQAGIWLLLITVYYVTLSTPIILPSFHPLANSLGLVLLINGILVVQPTHTADQKYHGAISHSILNGLGVLSFLIGAIIIFYNKSIHNAPHFVSTHAKFGVITFTLLVLQMTIGILQFYFPQLFGGENRAKALYKWHRAAGYLISAVALVTVTLGTQTPYFHGKIHSTWIWILFDLLIVLGTIPRIKPSKMKLF